jgi:hypothetical protein
VVSVSGTAGESKKKPGLIRRPGHKIRAKAFID